MPKFKKCDRVKVLEHGKPWHAGQLGRVNAVHPNVPGRHSAPMPRGEFPRAGTRNEYDVTLDIGKPLWGVWEENLELVPTESG